MKRTAQLKRDTNETQIEVMLSLDGTGRGEIDTGVGFFDHMLQGLARHGLFDLTACVKGDLHVDDHHTIEDLGIVLGGAVKEAIGDKKGLKRYGKLADLSDMFTEEFVADVNNDPLLASCKAGDTPYMYPISSAPFYMAFNKEMAVDAGVAEKIKDGWTTADFQEVITALKDKGYMAGSVFCSGQGGDCGNY